MKTKSIGARKAALQKWQKVVASLRAVIEETPLIEESKWNLPCFSHESSNIAIIQPFKEFVALMFFKGSLLKDAKGLLKRNGPNSRHGCRFEFATVEDVSRLKLSVKSYIKEAIKLDLEGAKVKPSSAPKRLPSELTNAFRKDAAFKKAFLALTPGRQRAYVIFISGAKQSETRVARIEKHRTRIMRGFGMHD
jgi:uncharacterized protein YdeI (YjbR/CyaY-like superfamily)